MEHTETEAPKARLEADKEVVVTKTDSSQVV